MRDDPGSKTMVKLVWALVAIVLILGLVRVAMVYEKSQDTDRKILKRQTK